MSGRHSFCAVVPFKGTAQAKQRLASALTAPQRHALALAMLGDVLQTLAAVDELGGVLVVTADAAATALAAQFGAQVSAYHAREGHTGAVLGAVNGPARPRPRPHDCSGRRPAGDAGRHPPAARRACARRGLHHRAGTRRSRLQFGAVHARRCGAAALRRQQLLPASRRRPRARHRAPNRAAAADRARHRHARGPGAVPGDAVDHARARAARSSRPARRCTHAAKEQPHELARRDRARACGRGAIARRRHGARSPATISTR